MTVSFVLPEHRGTSKHRFCCHKTLSLCPTRVPHKSVLQECPTRVSYKSVPQECPTRVSVTQGVPQECTRVSHKCSRQECVLQECPTRVSPTRVSTIVWPFVFEYVFAFGFVGSIFFSWWSLAA